MGSRILGFGYMAGIMRFGANAPLCMMPKNLHSFFFIGEKVKVVVRKIPAEFVAVFTACDLHAVGIAVRAEDQRIPLRLKRQLRLREGLVAFHIHQRIGGGEYLPR